MLNLIIFVFSNIQKYLEHRYLIIKDNECIKEGDLTVDIDIERRTIMNGEGTHLTVWNANNRWGTTANSPLGV